MDGFKQVVLYGKRLFPLIFSVVLLFSSLAMADTVILKQPGQQESELKGTVQSVTEREVILITPEGARLPLNRESVSRILFQPLRIDPMQPVSQPATRMGQPQLDHETPITKAPLPLRKLGADKALVRFPTDKQTYDEKRFVILSRFVGHLSKNLYAGLYNFDQKGTFWLYLNYPMAEPGLLSFTLYGKKNASQPTENYTVKARFMDANGNELGESPLAFYDDANPKPLEWFMNLEGISGLGGDKIIEWRVPKGTKTIELRAMAAAGGERHLVGYLSNLQLSVGRGLEATARTGGSW